MKTFSIFLALSVLVFFSCGGSGGGASMHSLSDLVPIETETCCITTPEPNAELVSLLVNPSGARQAFVLVWNIKYLSPEGTVKTIPADFTGTAQTLSLDFAKNRVTPVLVYLTINGAETILPAGAIYPLNKTGSMLSVSWLNGTSAQVLFDILTKADQPQKDAQHLCNYFNWQKFQEEFAKRIDEPHLVKKDAIEEKICTGNFSVSVIKEIKAFDATFQHDNLEWLCAPCGDAKPVYAGESACFPSEKTVYLSSHGTVLVEKESAKNALVITELAR